MAPLHELHAAQDDVAAFAQQHRFAPIYSQEPDRRKADRRIPNSQYVTRTSPWITDADSSTVLDLLVEEHELDDERVDMMLQMAAEKRIRQQAPATTPHGTGMAGIAVDACALLQDLQRCIENLDFFSAGDTGLGDLQRTAQAIQPILARMWVRHG